MAECDVCCLSVVCLGQVIDCGQMGRVIHMVTMKHLREVDIGLSESAHKFDLGCPSGSHFEGQESEIVRILTVASRLKVPINKNVHGCPLRQ